MIFDNSKKSRQLIICELADLRQLLAEAAVFSPDKEGKAQSEASMAEALKLNPPMDKRSLASLLGVSLPTVNKLIKSGQISAFNVGRSIRIKFVEVQRYIDEQLTPKA
ncbi:hypothetical protein GCM10027037_03360 [Mucilaginibacter koreensis]